MKTVIISDVHLRVGRVKHIIEREAPDKVVFLGDWYDQFDDTIEETQETANWVHANINNPNYVFLWGNHDVSYSFTNRYARCSGYTENKDRVIHDIISFSDWDKFDWFHWLDDNILCSHAGLNKELALTKIGNKTLSLKNIKKLLSNQEVVANMNLRSNKPHWFYQAGRFRGGIEQYGGLVWCDVREFVPIEGIVQIFGHTVLKEPKFFKNGDVCFDTNNNHYLIYLNEKLEIKNYIDL